MIYLINIFIVDAKVEEELTANTEENKLRQNIEAAERQLHEVCNSFLIF